MNEFDLFGIKKKKKKIKLQLHNSSFLNLYYIYTEMEPAFICAC